MKLTPDELVTLTALVNVHVRQMLVAIRHPELTEAGREQYRRDIIQCERLAIKLQALAADAVEVA